MTDRVLFISPRRADATLISRMLGPASLELEHVHGIVHAAALLRRKTYAAILTECRLPDGCWKDVLDFVERTVRCQVVVTDRLADDVLWADVLSLGAYDFLAQPFDPDEVRRILTNACLQSRAVAPPMRSRAALPVNF